MKELNVKLDNFEGPLDLLLHLIKTMEIDIYDIPIAEITEQYMAFIHTMKELDLEVAGEFIVMAATLMSIKSKMLLPQEIIEVDEDADYDVSDPREELVQQLLDYKKFKYAAHLLKNKESFRDDYFFKEAMDLSEYERINKPLEPNEVTTIDLFLAFHDVLSRQKEKQPMETSISLEEFTIRERMDYVYDRVKQTTDNEGLDFDQLFETFTRNEIIMTFLALLELIKDHDIYVKQSSRYEKIKIYRKEGH